MTWLDLGTRVLMSFLTRERALRQPGLMRKTPLCPVCRCLGTALPARPGSLWSHSSGDSAVPVASPRTSTQCRLLSAPPQPARARRCRGFVCMLHRHLFPIPSKLQIWKYEPPAALWVSVARCLFCMPVTSLSTVRTSVLKA